MTFGERVQLLRKQKKMSQEELGEKLEVTRQTISKWELDQSTPDLDYIVSISEFFGVTTDYLIKGEEKEVRSGQGAVMPVPQLQFFGEDDLPSGTGNTVPAPASVSAVLSSAPDRFIIQLNLKAVFRYFMGLVMLFFGGLGVLFAISFMSQPHYYGDGLVIFLSSSLLIIGSSAVFLAGLSVFARLLLRYSEAVGKLCSKIGRSVSAFSRAFKASLTEEAQSGAAADDAAKAFSAKENTAPVSSENPQAAVKSASPFRKTAAGVLLTLVSLIGGFTFIAHLSHFYDTSSRSALVFLFDIVCILLALAGTVSGIKITAREKSKAANRTGLKSRSEISASDVGKAELKPAASESAVTDGCAAAVKSADGSQARSFSKKSVGLLLLLLSAAGGFMCISLLGIYYGYSWRTSALPAILGLIFLLFVLAGFCVGIKLLIRSGREKYKAVYDTAVLNGQEELATLSPHQREKVLKIRQIAEAKADEEREMYRLRAEAISPNDSAAAESLIARGEAKAAEITEKAEKKLLKYGVGTAQFGKSREKGAHLREKQK